LDLVTATDIPIIVLTDLRNSKHGEIGPVPSFAIVHGVRR